MKKQKENLNQSGDTNTDEVNEVKESVFEETEAEKTKREINEQFKKLDKIVIEKFPELQEPTKKKFRIPRLFYNINKKADRGTEFVPVMYLSLKQQVQFLCCRVVSGDIVVINNKAHIIDPKKVWRFKKYIFYIIREIDRQPVSNEDIDRVRERGDDTEADVPLIKAVLGATNKPTNPLKNISPTVWVLIGLAVLAAIFFMSKGGGAA